MTESSLSMRILQISPLVTIRNDVLNLHTKQARANLGQRSYLGRKGGLEILKDVNLTFRVSMNGLDL